jgi:hypothetical protein
MFRINFEGNEVKVYFKYNRPIGHTYCGIKVNDEEVCHGESLCSSKDNFNYNSGRKAALARALKQFSSEPDTRKEFWDAYFKVRGKVS